MKREGDTPSPLRNAYRPILAIRTAYRLFSASRSAYRLTTITTKINWQSVACTVILANVSFDVLDYLVFDLPKSTFKFINLELFDIVCHIGVFLDEKWTF